MNIFRQVGTELMIVDGDLIVAESGAIIEHLIGVHGDCRLKAVPSEPDRADCLWGEV